jgi:hypothetical protein
MARFESLLTKVFTILTGRSRKNVPLHLLRSSSSRFLTGGDGLSVIER